MKLEDGTIIEHVWTDWNETAVTKHRKELKSFGLHVYADPTNFANINSHIISNRKLNKKEIRRFIKLLL